MIRGIKFCQEVPANPPIHQNSCFALQSVLPFEEESQSCDSPIKFASNNSPKKIPTVLRLRKNRCRMASMPSGIDSQHQHSTLSFFSSFFPPIYVPPLTLLVVHHLDSATDLARPISGSSSSSTLTSPLLSKHHRSTLTTRRLQHDGASLIATRRCVVDCSSTTASPPPATRQQSQRAWGLPQQSARIFYFRRVAVVLLAPAIQSTLIQLAAAWAQSRLLARVLCQVPMQALQVLWKPLDKHRHGHRRR